MENKKDSHMWRFSSTFTKNNGLPKKTMGSLLFDYLHSHYDNDSLSLGNPSISPPLNLCLYYSLMCSPVDLYSSRAYTRVLQGPPLLSPPWAYYCIIKKNSLLSWAPTKKEKKNMSRGREEENQPWLAPVICQALCWVLAYTTCNFSIIWQIRIIPMCDMRLWKMMKLPQSHRVKLNWWVPI